MPAVTGVLETALYVADLERSRRFYEDLFGFEALVSDARMCAMSVAGRQVLLLFVKRASLSLATPHDGDGQLHVAFSIAREELEAWEARLTKHEIPIESTVTWSAGGKSLYFRDPDRHLVELATPGVWRIY